MRLVRTGRRRGDFSYLAATKSAQAFMMVLAPGTDTGQLENEHPRSEQWLFVVSGNGIARVGRRRIALHPNCLLLINKREIHQIQNRGRRDLVTLNFYCPPAYTPKGNSK